MNYNISKLVYHNQDQMRDFKMSMYISPKARRAEVYKNEGLRNTKTKAYKNEVTKVLNTQYPK